MFEGIVTTDHIQRKNDAEMLPQRKNIAVMVVGEGRSQGTFVWLSIQSYVIKPIIEHYQVPWVDAFICVGNSGEDKTLKEFMSYSNSSSNHVHVFETNMTTENTSISPQFQRIEKCYGHIQRQSSNRYDFIVKTRPDIWWFDSITLPFSTQHVMTRARTYHDIKNVTLGHLSFDNCYPICSTNETIHPPCGMIDDQIAVVPYRHQDAYFRFSSNLDVFAANKTEQKMPAKVIDNMRWTMLPLSLSCPCLMKTWPEGVLTSRLARLNVSVALARFSVLLANTEEWGFRWGFTPQKRDFNALSPPCAV